MQLVILFNLVCWWLTWVKANSQAMQNKTILAAAKIQIECIRKYWNGEGVDVCIMYTLLLKKTSSRKHWYQSHSHTHSNNRDMGCGVPMGWTPSGVSDQNPRTNGPAKRLRVCGRFVGEVHGMDSVGSAWSEPANERACEAVACLWPVCGRGPRDGLRVGDQTPRSGGASTFSGIHLAFFVDQLSFNLTSFRPYTCLHHVWENLQNSSKA
jgi:hypothetical protein